jgi:hypothetical protein
MVKKVFALASVTALGGLVAAVSAAGCTTTEVVQQTSDSGVVDAGKKQNDSGTKVPGDDEADAGGPDTCLAPEPIDVSKVPYKQPIVTPGACKPEILTFIKDYLKANPEATFTDFREAVIKEDATCGACVFSTPEADKWGTIVINNAGAGFLHFGGCIEIVSGERECGAAFTQWDVCIRNACKTCSEDEMQECGEEAQAPGAACGAPSKALFEACGNNVNAFIEACRDINALITKACIGGSSKDAGSDAQ